MKFLLAFLVLIGTIQAQNKNSWRVATPRELELALPARATVEKDHIEVEMRTLLAAVFALGCTTRPDTVACAQIASEIHSTISNGRACSQNADCVMYQGPRAASLVNAEQR